MRFISYDIVFQEIPDEVTLAINITGCPCHCVGCHSPHLWEDTGDELSEETLAALLSQYGRAVTCVCLMGGDADPATVNTLAAWIRAHGYKSAWYSGRALQSEMVETANLDYLKLGPYIESRGPLKSPTTNQRLYRIHHPADAAAAETTPLPELEDITRRFWR
mgnify:CR=1 FL=1